MTDKANSRGRLLTDEIDEMLRQMLEELVASGDFEAKLNDKGERLPDDRSRSREIGSGPRAPAMTTDKQASQQ